MSRRFPALVVLLLSACSTTESRKDGPRRDGFVWPDFRPTMPDVYRPPPYPDQGTPRDTGRPGDLLAPDSAGSCTIGSSSCTGCAGSELCTALKGGTCGSAVVLPGSSTDKPVLVKVTEAIVSCRNKFSLGKNMLCSGFDTCALSGTINQAVLDDFVCKKAQASDFSSPAIYTGTEGARSIFNCDGYLWGIYRIDWKTTIAPSEQGSTCLGFRDYLGGPLDRVEVVGCAGVTL